MIDIETTEPPPSPIVRGFTTFPMQPPAEDVLAGDAWLRRGDVAFFNSSAGAGKSVALTQVCIAWGLGLPFAGIQPSRPLKILHFVGEDDESTLGQCREGLRDHAREVFGREFREGEIEQLDTMVRTDFSRQHVGKEFVAYLDRLLTEEPADLVLVNPLLSYIGGEIVSSASEFLRVGLMPVLQKHRAASLIAHHTNKLAKDGWDTIDPTYSGTGGGEVANVPRTILTLMPTKAPGLSVLKVSKRQTTGWKDDEGRFTDHVFLKRTDNPSRPAWIPIGHDEAAGLIEEGATGNGQSNGRSKLTAEDFAPLLASGPMMQQAVIDTTMRTKFVGLSTVKTKLAEAKGRELVKFWSEPQARGGKPAVWLCHPSHFAEFAPNGQ